MFKNPFSFDGRIRRTEFGITYLIYFIVYCIFLYITNNRTELGIVWLVFIPIFWIKLAQSAKRCHDLGNSGWWQLIPLYEFWMLFSEGQARANAYGRDPKEKLEYGSESYVRPETGNTQNPFDDGAI